jgi:zinc transport system substrate-binding protein
MRLGVGLVAVVTALVVAAGCGSTRASGGTTVVAAFYPLEWVAQQVGGPAVHVVDLTPSGAEPHDIELTPRDVEDVQRADLVLYLGGGFQPAVQEAVGSRSGPSLDLLAGQALRSSSGAPGDGEALDPHVWLDPTRLATMATAVGRELGRERQAARLVARLHRLDRELRSGLATCRRHEIVTSHAAFGYFAQRYGLDQIALTGIAPEVEPRPRDLERLVHEVEKSRATTVFFETLVSPKLAETIAREAGVETAVLNPLEGLTSSEVAAGDDYVSIMKSNLATLRAALGCR